MRRERGRSFALRGGGGQALRRCVRARRGRFSLGLLDSLLALGRRLGLACCFVIKELRRSTQTLLARFGSCLPSRAGPRGSRLNAGTAALGRTGGIIDRLGRLREHVLSPRLSLGRV